MKYLHRVFAVASAAFFIASSALAQNAGTVSNHAFAIGKGPGTTGYSSLLCGSAQLAVGQSAADPICRTITGDVTISAAGVTAIGATKVTNAMLATMAANTTKCNATAGSAVPTDCNASTVRTNIGVVIGTNVEAWDADLDCISALSLTGVMVRTGAGACATRTLTAPAAGITITNGDGVAGNPTLVLANDLAALEALAGTGIARRTATDTWTVGTTVSVAEGGTGQASLNPNQILASGTTSQGSLQNVAAGTTTTVLHGNASGLPTFGAVSNADHATMPAFTIKGNATGSSAAPADVSIPALTQKATPVAADKVMIADSAAAGALKYATVSSLAAVPTITRLTSGSGTYTTPASVRWIEIEMVGGGGGGGGGSANFGSLGGSTCWNTSGAACTSPVLLASGGSGGSFAAGGASGGGSSGGNVYNVAGGGGGAYFSIGSGFGGGFGGGSCRGGAGQGGGVPGNGSAGATGSGSGGGGAGATAVAAGAGGGAGGCLKHIITSPAATYTYVVGAPGAGALPGTNSGGDGGSGEIDIIEHY